MIKRLLFTAAIVLAGATLARPSRADLISPAEEACANKHAGDRCIQESGQAGVCVAYHDARRGRDRLSCNPPPARSNAGSARGH